ncbi:class I SAM-dependent methyltransferase [soil metagenome]
MRRLASHKLLRQLTELYPDARYLEVGVSRAVTFDRVPAAQKVAVDPAFDLDLAARRLEDPVGEYHEVTSDEYFGRIVEPGRQFDVIYLDGLHLVEQTLRDLMNALHHLAPNGVIVIDDTRPPTHLASLPDRAVYEQVRTWLGLEHQKAWMGDVYRLVYFIETFCQQLTYRTILDNHGQTVVWRARRESVPERRLPDVAALTFEQLVAQQGALRLTTFDETRRRLCADLGLG